MRFFRLDWEAMIFRNREFLNFAIVFAVCAAAGTLIGFLFSPEAGILALALSAVLGTAFFVFTRARYRRLSRFSEQIDRVLHNVDLMDLGDFQEGELSILHSEISKMTLHIREQNDNLKKEKLYLADSLADIAHQLRTPLTSANLILSLLAKSTDEAERESSLYEVERLLLQMDWLVTTLLKLSRLDGGVVTFNHEPVCVYELMQSALSALAIPMELRNITVLVDIPEDITISGDARWLGEALSNILKNCLEHCGEGGTIEVSCSSNPLFTELTIRDSGPGFSEKDLAHVFDRFYRGEYAEQATRAEQTGQAGFETTGFGIGLALSKKIITELGATITARNHPNGGALFTIRFQK